MTTPPLPNLYDVLAERGLVSQVTDEKIRERKRLLKESDRRRDSRAAKDKAEV